MPLKKGYSDEVVSSNIREMMKAGHSQKQAIAAALAMKRKSKKQKMADGGQVKEQNPPPQAPPVNTSAADDFVKGFKKATHYAVGGRVGSSEEYDDNEDPMVPHKGHNALRDAPDMESESEMDDLGVDSEQRDLNAIRMQGEYYPSEVANPVELKEAKRFAEAMKRKAEEVFSQENPEGETDMEYAMGGLVQPDHGMPLGNKPSEDMREAPREDMHPEPKEDDPDEHKLYDSVPEVQPSGLSREAMEAILKKKKGRRYPKVT